MSDEEVKACIQCAYQGMLEQGYRPESIFYIWTSPANRKQYEKCLTEMGFAYDLFDRALDVKFIVWKKKEEDKK